MHIKKNTTFLTPMCQSFTETWTPKSFKAVFKTFILGRGKLKKKFTNILENFDQK